MADGRINPAYHPIPTEDNEKLSSLPQLNSQLKMLKERAKLLQSSYEIGDFVLLQIEFSETVIRVNETLCYVVHLDKGKRGLWSTYPSVILAYETNGIVRGVGLDDRLFRKASDDEISELLTPQLEEFIADRPISHDALPGTLLRPRKHSSPKKRDTLMCLISWQIPYETETRDLEIFYVTSQEGKISADLVHSGFVCEYVESS